MARRSLKPTLAVLGGETTHGALRSQADAAADALAALVAQSARRIPLWTAHPDEVRALDLGLQPAFGHLLLQMEYAALSLGTRRAELEVRALKEHHARRLFAVADPPDAAPLASGFDPFGVIPEAALRWVRKKALTLARSVADDLHAAVRSVLLDAVGGKLAPGETVSGIRRVLQTTESRARLIAVTESTASFNAGRAELFDDAGVDWWRFSAILDERTSDICESRNGLVMLADDPAWQDNTPPLHGNCLTAGAVITGARVRATATRWYEGEVVDIETAGGHRLTVTPNHPVLTPEGWVSAGLLHEGGDVIGSSSPERLAAAIDPDDYQVPALIEDVAQADETALAMLAATVPVAAEDFHGDGIGSKVCVVRANRLLGHRLDAALAQPEAQERFGRRNVETALLARGGAATQAFDGLFRAAPGGVGSFGVAEVLLGRAIGGQQAIGIGAPAPRGAGLLQIAKDGIFADAIGSADLVRRFAGQVTTDQIVRIGRHPFSGHVYNLETDTGWYIANSIIVHNCRSLISPIIGRLEPGLVNDRGLQDWSDVAPLPGGWQSGAFRMPAGVLEG